MEDKNPIQVAGRLFGTLEFLAENGASALNEIALAQDLNKSTVHRLLTSLQYMGYVKQKTENGKYELTYKLAELSEKMVSRIDVIDEVRPHLQELCQNIGETVHLVKREGAETIYIDKVESDRNNVRMVSRIGSSIPFYRSAVGKVLAAEMKPDDVQRLWNSCDIERTTPNTITSFRKFLEALDEVRENGYALDNEENELGVRCIAAALDIPGSNCEYAFSISVPISRMDDERIAELAVSVKAVRQKIAAELR